MFGLSILDCKKNIWNDPSVLKDALLFLSSCRINPYRKLPAVLKEISLNWNRFHKQYLLKEWSCSIKGSLILYRNGILPSASTVFFVIFYSLLDVWIIIGWNTEEMTTKTLYSLQSAILLAPFMYPVWWKISKFYLILISLFKV